MGLDMYLSAKRYYSNVSWRGEQDQKSFEHLKEMSGVGTVIDKVDLPHIYLEVSVGYWRKENQIHKWFVDNCQNGEDDCRTSYVSREQLEALRSACLEVLKDNSKAEELLPRQEGFFFGGTDLDEWYFNGLKDTVEIINSALEMPLEWEFEYHSSW